MPLRSALARILATRVLRVSGSFSHPPLALPPLPTPPPSAASRVAFAAAAAARSAPAASPRPVLTSFAAIAAAAAAAEASGLEEADAAATDPDPARARRVRALAATLADLKRHAAGLDDDIAGASALKPPDALLLSVACVPYCHLIRARCSSEGANQRELCSDASRRGCDAALRAPPLPATGARRPCVAERSCDAEAQRRCQGGAGRAASQHGTTADYP